MHKKAQNIELFNKKLNNCQGGKMILDITKYKRDAVAIKSGASKKFLFFMNNVPYIFKENYAGLRQDLIEVFSSFFLKKTKCQNFVEYDFAEMKGLKGCICQSFKDENVQYEINFLDILLINFLKSKHGISQPLGEKIDDDLFTEFYSEKGRAETDYGLYDMSIEYVCSHLKNYCENYKIKIDFNELEKRLNEMVVYDYFMGNGDRNWQNIDFLIKNSSGSLCCELAPIFDNGEAFGFTSEKRTYESTEEPQNSIDFSMFLGISDIGRKITFENNKLFNEGGLVAVDIHELSKKDKRINELVEKCKDINMDDMLKEFESHYKVAMPEKIKEQIAGFYAKRLDHYNKTVYRLNSKISGKRKSKDNEVVTNL